MQTDQKMAKQIRIKRPPQTKYKVQWLHPNTMTIQNNPFSVRKIKKWPLYLILVSLDPDDGVRRDVIEPLFIFQSSANFHNKRALEYCFDAYETKKK